MHLLYIKWSIILPYFTKKYLNKLVYSIYHRGNMRTDIDSSNLNKERILELVKELESGGIALSDNTPALQIKR